MIVVGADMELVALARNPVPSGAVVSTFKGYDGAPLRYAWFDATRGPRRGTMCVFTGRTEYIEKYFEVIADLRRRGYAVAIMDWRGQGGSWRALSDRRKGYVKDFSEYDHDLACFMRQVVLPDCPPPYVALAHSMGGNILLRNAGAPGTWFERMVLISPMIMLHASQLGVPEPLARAYAELGAAVGLGRLYTRGSSPKPYEQSAFENNVLTSDRERYQRNCMLSEASPQLVLGGPTVRWLRAALRSMKELNDPAYARRIGVPLLFFIAGKDTVVEPRAIEDFSSRLKVGTHVIIANAKHEILQESDDIRGRFWAAFDAYMGVAEAEA